MEIPRRQALIAGAAAIACIIALQAFNSVACYEHTLLTFLLVLGVFVLAPLLPAIVSLFTANPLRAVGACLLFAPWLVFAYYVDCVRPYQGGGASMIYVAVLLWGTPCAIVGALLTGPVMRLFGLSVAPRR
ncbi:Na+:solute symporter [Pseudoxanthomonas sp. PXM01]|uniref:Na+:solute symporter n=1 Tax=Pseudoxanthomonas sp. PXM01 TaxID=2769295 RepID=UPI00178195CD|nr:Na+:solute symporter [Pseudoxanthomonas sp. PXM01]MBD9471171.1 Na+:solute symporter [Pseudoxanthomonas sp. PXM01]